MMDALSEVGATREVGPGPSYSNDVRKATDLMLIVKINSHNITYVICFLITILLNTKFP